TRSARCLVAIGVAIALTPSWLPTLGPRVPLTSYKPAATVTSLSLSTWIRTTFPLQSAATQNNNIPATKRWALLIGLNDYAGSTVSNIGSRQDATELYAVLLKLGWRKDHIMLIVDLNGTASHIIDAIRWLASKTNAYSTVVFHYSGHENWTRTLAD